MTAIYMSLRPRHVRLPVALFVPVNSASRFLYLPFESGIVTQHKARANTLHDGLHLTFVKVEYRLLRCYDVWLL
jgi:hypothetical protein